MLLDSLYIQFSFVPSWHLIEIKRRFSNRLKVWFAVLLQLIYLIDLLVDNLFQCFTFSPTQRTVSLETKSPEVIKLSIIWSFL